MVRVRFWYSVMMSFAFFSHWSRLSTSPWRIKKEGRMWKRACVVSVCGVVWRLQVLR